jgi:hypothetical protein
MIEFAIVTVKTGASISNSMAESVTSASFVLGADQREGSNVLIVAHLLSVHSYRISLQATAIVAIQSNSACIINVYLKKCLPITEHSETLILFTIKKTTYITRERV